MDGRDRRSIAAMVAIGATLTASALTGVASADTATYPAGAGTFTGSAQGWTGSAASCGLVDGACATRTEYSSRVGNPAGSIDSRLDLLVNAGGLFKGQSTWTSPDFQVPEGSPTRGAAVALDRRLDGPVGALGPRSAFRVELIDRTRATRSTILSQTLDESDARFERTAAPVRAAAVVPGHVYALAIRTTQSTTIARVGLLGTLNSRYDNVNLSVGDSDVPMGLRAIGDGAQGTDGVAVRRTPFTDAAIARLIRSLRLDAGFGRGNGGSIVPHAKCTIVGTPWRDRIVGTRGNDVICGRGGNDVIRGSGGRDVIDTGNGSDRARGDSGDDVLFGLRGNDRLDGQAGRDRLGGGRGNDRLNGGSGRDRITGGAGHDRIR